MCHQLTDVCVWCVLCVSGVQQLPSCPVHVLPPRGDELQQLLSLSGAEFIPDCDGTAERNHRVLQLTSVQVARGVARELLSLPTEQKMKDALRERKLLLQRDAPQSFPLRVLLCLHTAGQRPMNLPISCPLAHQSSDDEVWYLTPPDAHVLLSSARAVGATQLHVRTQRASPSTDEPADERKPGQYFNVGPYKAFARVVAQWSVQVVLEPPVRLTHSNQPLLQQYMALILEETRTTLRTSVVAAFDTQNAAVFALRADSAIPDNLRQSQELAEEAIKEEQHRGQCFLALHVKKHVDRSWTARDSVLLLRPRGASPHVGELCEQLILAIVVRVQSIRAPSAGAQPASKEKLFHSKEGDFFVYAAFDSTRYTQQQLESEAQWDAVFVANLTPQIRQYAACYMAAEEGTYHLFQELKPNIDDLVNGSASARPALLNNFSDQRMPGLNDCQRHAASSFVRQVITPTAPSSLQYVQGPPGSGKTNMLKALVLDLLGQTQHKILLCAPSRRAVDVAFAAILSATLDTGCATAWNSLDARFPLLFVGEGVEDKPRAQWSNGEPPARFERYSLDRWGPKLVTQLQEAQQYVHQWLAAWTRRHQQPLSSNSPPCSWERCHQLLVSFQHDVKLFSLKWLWDNEQCFATQDEWANKVFPQLLSLPTGASSPEALLLVLRFACDLQNRIEHLERMWTSKHGRLELQLHLLNHARLVCCTASVAARKPFHLMNKIGAHGAFKFSALLFDEAGQALTPEVLIPLTSAAARHVLLVGDPQQLPPCVITHELKHSLLARSAMQMAIGKHRSHAAASAAKSAATMASTAHCSSTSSSSTSDSSSFVMLEEQYRMHPNICAFPSQHFYRGQLRTASSVYARQFWHRLPSHSSGSPLLPLVSALHDGVVLINVARPKIDEALEQQDPLTKSMSNPAECAAALSLLSVLESLLPHVTGNLPHFALNKHVRIITFYSAQVQLLRDALRVNGNGRFKQVRVETVDSFQGGESDVIILSCVRSNSTAVVGFLDDHRLNVAMTRARHAIIIVADADTMCRSGCALSHLIPKVSSRCTFTFQKIQSLAQLPRSTFEKYGYDELGWSRMEHPSATPLPAGSPRLVGIEPNPGPGCFAASRGGDGPSNPLSSLSGHPAVSVVASSSFSAATSAHVLLHLCTDVLLSALKFLECVDLLHLSQCSKAARTLVLQPAVWVASQLHARLLHTV